MALGLATSTDGLTWTKSVSNPVLAGTVVTATHSGLESTTPYTATVTDSDGWGNTMAAPVRWSFTTTSATHQIYLPIVIKNW